MKIASKKPRFFKPIQPGYKHCIKIPIGFLKYLKGLNHIKQAILRSRGKKWLVKVNGWRLEEGWKRFAKENDLQLGDLLIFKHEGDMEFQVSIFDSSHCDREYAEYLQEEEGKYVEATSKKVEKEAATHSSWGQSHFECIVRPYSISKGFLRLPKQFAMDNGLFNKKCGLLIRDERQRSWNLRLVTYDSSVCAFGGWSDFCAVNNLKEGDYMMFEVVANGEKPIWKFHYLRHKTSDMTTPISQTPASTSADANPHFISTIRRYTFTKAILYFPMRFVKSNGLMSRSEMILVDEKQRSWSVLLGQMEHHFGIKRGWPQFRKANGLQEGDTYKFELTNNGTIPIIHMSFLKYLNGHDQYEHAILGRAGDMEFEVSIFDLRQCDRICRVSSTRNRCNYAEEISKNFEFKEFHFFSTDPDRSLLNQVQKIPIGFLKYLEGLNHIKHAILKRMGKKWLMKVNGWRLEEGWEKFAEEHDLQSGDILVFKHEGDMEFEVPIFDSSHCDREYTEYLLEGVDNAEETFKKVEFKEAASHNCWGQSHYQCIVRPNYISNGYLYLPMDFVKSNGLMSRSEMILIDEKQRSWSVWLVRTGHQFGFKRGWTQFRNANSIQVGDTYKFELTNNGTIPIAHVNILEVEGCESPSITEAIDKII
ncbi:putative B3 domain-containing protein REM15 [Solanum pennellii]|uniref:B3 domain-containing protein REM15 n=1 Tax=Solanum pennellii TaxID=28526 RepID=A0ABM1HDV6_SOLPN|nr:putative B3 domain-containing protein REM15 [Solanum pennellii]